MCCIKRDDLEGSAVPAFPERSFLNDNKTAFDRPLDIEELKQYTKFNEGTTEQDLLEKTSEAYAPPYEEGNGTKADILAQNRVNGRVFEQQEFVKFSQNYSDAVEQITIKTSSGVKTRVDAIGLDSKGNVVINEFKSSVTAPLTPNQKIAFPEITESGGTVVGKGKGLFIGGYQIPQKIKIIRPR